MHFDVYSVKSIGKMNNPICSDMPFRVHKNSFNIQPSRATDTLHFRRTAIFMREQSLERVGMFPSVGGIFLSLTRRININK